MSVIVIRIHEESPSSIESPRGWGIESMLMLEGVPSRANPSREVVLLEIEKGEKKQGAETAVIRGWCLSGYASEPRTGMGEQDIARWREDGNS